MVPVDLPALHASHGGSWLRDGSGPAGRTRGLSKGEAITAAADTPLLMLNAPLVASRLGYPDLSGLDLLELFAFVHPARSWCRPPKAWPMRWGWTSRQGISTCLSCSRALLQPCWT